MKYPIGIQTFSEIREKGFAYVDKTAYVYRLADEGKYYFLSRPRRFGKSLLLSTIEAYFQGRRDLFEGLAIESLEKDWNQYPVLHFDLNIGSYTKEDGVDTLLANEIGYYEQDYGCPDGSAMAPGIRFGALLRHIFSTTGRQVVILVDEYDKPLLETIGNTELQETYRAQLKPFYGVLKTCDSMIRFAMLTGVTKYGHLSVFSDLNNLKDISLSEKYSTVCGITKADINKYFHSTLVEMAEKHGMSYGMILERLTEYYDGYRFSFADERVFNPFSLLNAFSDLNFGRYWFRTGTPSYLVSLIRHRGMNLANLEGKQVHASVLESVDAQYSSPIAVIYQSGYLTIKGYDAENELYTLGFPNTEVANGFLDFVLPIYTGIPKEDGPMTVAAFLRDVNEGNVPDFMERLQSLFADTPYSANKDYEAYYQDILFVVFRLLGLRVECEHHTARGRIDFVVKTRQYIYIMEFKFNAGAEEALKQIHEKGYATPYLADAREKILLGVNFSPVTRNIDSWLKETCN